MENVIVLNADYSYLNSVSWENAITLIYKNVAIAIKETDRIVSNVDKTFQFLVPKVIKLVRFVNQVFKGRIPYSKRNVFVRDDFTCQYCGDKLTEKQCTIDHVIPRAKGGKSEWSNCVCSCKDCNNWKADKDLYKISLSLKHQPIQPSVADFIRKKSKHFKIEW